MYDSFNIEFDFRRINNNCIIQYGDNMWISSSVSWMGDFGIPLSNYVVPTSKIDCDHQSTYHHGIPIHLMCEQFVYKFIHCLKCWEGRNKIKYGREASSLGVGISIPVATVSHTTYKNNIIIPKNLAP